MNFDKVPWKSFDDEENAFFCYDLDALAADATKIKSILAGFSEHSQVVFSLKANPHPKIIDTLRRCLDGFDVSSELELSLCRSMGIDGSSISVSGPGKTDNCLVLAKAMNAAVVQVDSLDELLVAQGLGIKNLSFRIHTPDIFSLKLGLSDEDLHVALGQLKSPCLGLHLYLGRESFSWDRLSQAASVMESWFQKYPKAFVERPTMFLGPGIPGGTQPEPYFGVAVKYPVVFELGRGVVAPCGFYAAQVLSRKKMDRGGEALILHGGLQHLGSPFVTFAQRVDELRPTCIRSGHELVDQEAEFLVAGSLCLGHDILHPRLKLPKNIQRGDWVIFPRAGAYGLTAGVPFFIGQELPKELVFENGKMQDATLTKFRLYHECFV